MTPLTRWWLRRRHGDGEWAGLLAPAPADTWVSLDLEKSAKYQGLGQQYSEEFKEWMVPLTANRPTSRGLRQNKWLR